MKTISMNKLIKVLFCLLVAGSVVACGKSDTSDIDKFIADARNKPKGVIDPIPVFKPYKAFRYNAASKRAPFDVPVQVRQVANLFKTSNVEPDPKRVQEQLESFNLESLSMVGTLERGGQRWALIDDGSGAVHQVLKGNYMGRNHGRIVSIDPDSVSLIEIVANGPESWVERPRTLSLKEG